MDKTVSDNEKTWDIVADQFFEASALPVWGPFDVGRDLNLIPDIKNRTFLEVGCGSGRSIKYLLKQGAEKVYGLDLSQRQLDEATRYNKTSVDQGKVVLIKGPMEEKIDIEPVDVVCSIYAIGWTPDPKATFKSIYSYLKPGGLFIWSWDHSFFSDVRYEDGRCVVVRSYHDEKTVTLRNWKNSGADAYITYRKTSTWFQLLREAGFEVVGYHEPAAGSSDKIYDDPVRYYSIQKAEKVPSSFIFVCRKN
ncbi:MAG: class I SAM-dependent methyltransferase [Candidatus Paceibacterota bacterium]|jgi:SAM-dependent methyltransferase